MEKVNILFSFILANVLVIFLMVLDTNMNDYKRIMIVCYLLLNSLSLMYFMTDELNEMRIVYGVLGSIAATILTAMVVIQLYMLSQNF